jgi:hypothetical protein
MEETSVAAALGGRVQDMGKMDILVKEIAFSALKRF